MSLETYFRTGLAGLTLISVVEAGCSEPTQVKTKPQTPIIIPTAVPTARIYTTGPEFGLPAEENDAQGGLTGVHGHAIFGDYHLFYPDGAKNPERGDLQLVVRPAYWLTGAELPFSTQLDSLKYRDFIVTLTLGNISKDRLGVVTSIGFSHEAHSRDCYIGEVPQFNPSATSIVELAWNKLKITNLTLNGIEELPHLQKACLP